MSATTDDELALELALDELEATLADERAPAWSAERRRAVAAAAATRGMRRRCLQLLQAHAPAWIEQSVAVASARLAAPDWAAYPRLRAAQEAAASQLFEADWVDVLRWGAGVPRGALPAPAPIAPPQEGYAAGVRPLPWEPVLPLLAAHALPHLRPYHVTVRFSDARPRTHVPPAPGLGGLPLRFTVELRDARDTPRAWFQLLHELGHVLAALICPVGWLPRAVDEAVAAWLARHLEEPGAFPGLPLHAYAPQVHADERARRAAVAGALAHLEAHPFEVSDGAGPARLPWALWHDPGAQPAYLHAEELAGRWWAEGLRLEDLPDLARAVTYAIAEARALPAPLGAVRP